MNAQSTEHAPQITKETKNKIRVKFERTSFWTRFRLKFLTGTAVTKGAWWLFRLILLLGISYVILLPFYSKISSSFMSRRDFDDITVRLIPKHPTLDTYKVVIQESGFLTALLNTTVLSISTALIQTFTCSFIAYGFAKYKFKGSKLLFALVLLTMIVPHKTLQMSMTMRFRSFDIGIGKYGILSLLGGKLIDGFKVLKLSSINLTNTYWPLYILSLGGLAFKNGLYIFMLRQFFRGVPDELEESAYIDGYGPFKTFIKIILPISVPMMITVFLFAFSWQWTDDYYVKIFFTTSGPKLMPSIINFAEKGSSQLDTSGAVGKLVSTAIRNTCGILVLTPLLIVYLFCQRYLVEGIERSGIVG